MATYRKGYKKMTTEDTLLRIIVGIIVGVLILVLFALGYAKLFVSRDYADFTAIDDFANIFTQKDTDSILIDKYVVYFYSESSVTCEDIKDDMLKLLANLEKDGYTVFILDNDNATDDTRSDYLTVIDESSVKVPTLITVVDGAFTDKYIGSDNAMNAIDSILDGTYEPFN